MVVKLKITHVVWISAQSEQVWESFTSFTRLRSSGSSSLNKSCSNKKKSVNKVVVKLKIAHVVWIWAQSEQLWESFTSNMIGFFTVRVVGTRSTRPEIAFLGSTQVWCTKEIYRFWVGISMVVLIPLWPQCGHKWKIVFVETTWNKWDIELSKPKYPLQIWSGV